LRRRPVEFDGGEREATVAPPAEPAEEPKEPPVPEQSDT